MKMDDNFLTYSALDAACTKEIHDKCWPELYPEFGPAYEMTINILPVLMFMQTRGIKVNRVALEETKIEVLQTAAAKQKELNELVGHPLNVDSPKQCQSYFYDELGITPYRNKEGRPTLDDKALQRLVRGTVARPSLKQAKLIQDIRGLQKLYGTYLNLEFDADSRLRCSFNPRGTKFGRLSSSKTIFGTGTNFQNLPPAFKKFLVPDEGYCFVEVDKRQAEWVAMAYLTGDANMIAAIEGGVDVHTYTACQMFDVPAEIVKRDNKVIGSLTDAELIYELRMGDEFLKPFWTSSWPRSMSLRQCGKKSNHGLNYDEGYKGFASINEIDEKEAKRIVDLYHQIYPGIRIWYESIKRMLMKDRTLTNCFGRVVRFLGAWNDQLWKSAYSCLPQATVVDSLNQGMVKIYNDEEICGVKGMNVDIQAQVHDSVLMQVPIKFLKNEWAFKNFLTKVTDYTSPDITYNGRVFKIASDFKFGLQNWSGGHPERNPFGMVEVASYEEFMERLTAWENLSGERAVGVVE